MDDLFISVRGYVRNELDSSAKLTLVKDQEWHTIRVELEDLQYDIQLREAGEFRGQPMVEIRLDRYGDEFSEFVQASDHVVARLIFS